MNAEKIFVSLALQYCLGANIFTSYYADRLLEKTPVGKSVLKKIKEIQQIYKYRKTPQIVLHYPIETMMRNRKPNIEKAIEYKDRCSETIIKCGNSVTECMYTILDMQLSLMFSDTASIGRLLDNPPKYFIVPFEERTPELDEMLYLLEKRGTKVLFVDNKKTLEKILIESCIVKTEGDTKRIASLWSDNGLLLVNSDKTKKSIVLDFIVENIIDCWYDSNVDFIISKNKTELTLRPYGVYSISF